MKFSNFILGLIQGCSFASAEARKFARTHLDSHTEKDGDVHKLRETKFQVGGLDASVHDFGLEHGDVIDVDRTKFSIETDIYEDEEGDLCVSLSRNLFKKRSTIHIEVECVMRSAPESAEKIRDLANKRIKR